LSRSPTSTEIENAIKYLESETDMKTAYGNLIWTLINTKEFIFVH